MSEQLEGDNKLRNFTFEGKLQSVVCNETQQVTDGVECDVYNFVGDRTKDLGIIRIKPGKHTPPQKVKKGDRTVEGYFSGKGRLVVIRDDKRMVNDVGADPTQKFSFDVEHGDLMQWQAAEDSSLVASEVCFPPFPTTPGRYEDQEDRLL